MSFVYIDHSYYYTLKIVLLKRSSLSLLNSLKLDKVLSLTTLKR